MNEYSINIVTKKKETMIEIISNLSQLDCEITIDKDTKNKPYSFNFPESAYQKLGEKRGRSIDEYKKDIEYYNYFSDILNEYGISDKHKGFRYAIECIRLMHVYGVEQYTLDADVYPVVSKWYNVTPASIEHNIRNAIKNAWNKNVNSFDKEKTKISVFDERPTNLKFLRHIADKTNYAIINAYK